MNTESTPLGNNDHAAFREALNRLAADAEREYQDWLNQQSDATSAVDEEVSASWDAWAKRECERLEADAG